jgi:hypothetical protein
MKHVRAFGMFWWDFVVGDDWRTALGIVIAIASTAVLVALGVNAWWVIQITVAILLGRSLYRGANE